MGPDCVKVFVSDKILIKLVCDWRQFSLMKDVDSENVWVANLKVTIK